MNDESYAYQTLQQYIDRYDREKKKDMVVAEIGFGRSVASAVYFYAKGAKNITLIDVEDGINRDLEFYRGFIDRLDRSSDDPEINGRLQLLAQADSFDGLLEKLRCDVRIINPLEGIPVQKSSLDFAFSHSVFQHIPLRSVRDHFLNVYESLVSGGVYCFYVDHKDCIAKGVLNYLIPAGIWETPLVHQAGFYTNRMGVTAIEAAAKDVGFDIEKVTEMDFTRHPPGFSVLKWLCPDVAREIVASSFFVIRKP